MSKCAVRIDLDRDSRSYKIGDCINCTVYVAVDKAVKCNGLVVHKSWFTHGRGNRSNGGDETHTLFKGEWLPGEYSYSCSFEIDSGPLTYHGRYINIDWQLMAKADIPWAIDPKGSVDFTVERGLGSRDQLQEKIPFEKKTLGLGKSPSLILLVPLVIAMVGSGFAINGWINHDFTNVIFGLLFFSGALIFGYIAIRNYIAQSKIGEVHIKIDPVSVQPGEETELSVNFTPKSMVAVNQIIAKLVAKEKAVSGSGTNRTTHTFDLHSEDYPLSGKCRLSTGLPVQHKVKIAVPTDAPHTFITSDNSIEWQLALIIDIDNWPDWSSSKAIQVLI